MRGLILAPGLIAAAASAWTVCLDPGHGGSSSGAVGTYYQEKQAVLEVALEAAFYLDMVAGCEWVGMTRTGDYDVSLQARCDYANANGFDRFVSIHENAYNTTVQGSEVFYETGTPALDLAQEVLDGILWAHGYNDRGVKNGDWLYVIANTWMPAILGEGTFIDYDLVWNESWRYLNWWNDHQGRQGWAYAAGIAEHMGDQPPPYGTGGDTVVDNLDQGFSVNDQGEWNTGAFGTPWVFDYRWSSTDDQDDWARWTPDLAESGWYEVYVWYVEGTNRAPDAVFTVHHAGGETDVTVDQTQGGEQWVMLGGFGFDSGSSGWITLSEDGTTPGTVVVADAVRFHPLSTGILEQVAPSAGGTLSMDVAPNPGTVFYVTMTLPPGMELELAAYDLSGRMVDRIHSGAATISGESIMWAPENLPTGVYTLVATTQLGSIARRVVLR